METEIETPGQTCDNRAAECRPPSPLVSIGDRVQFVRSKVIGASIGFKTMEGRIIEFSKPKGTKALIKYQGGNFIWKRSADLQRIGQPSPLNVAGEATASKKGTTP